MYSTIVRSKEPVISESVLDCYWTTDQVDCSSLKSADGRKWPVNYFLKN